MFGGNHNNDQIDLSIEMHNLEVGTDFIKIQIDGQQELLGMNIENTGAFSFKYNEDIFILGNNKIITFKNNIF